MTFGGKSAFLENYLRKRLLIQEALKSGFDKRPDVQADMEASRESTLFDRYVRDVISSRIVTEDAARQYYDAHQSEVETPERLHVRHIVIAASQSGPQARSKEQALEIIKRVATQLRGANVSTRTVADPKAAAVEWLKANPGALDAWLKDVTTFDGSGPAINAVKKGLGL